jgi:RNA polymerase sigma-70 factor, ECF subfamily
MPTAVSDIDEPELISLVRQGDARAFAALYERHANHVRGAARRLVIDPCAAEDVTQEVFTFFWQHPTRFDPLRGELRTLLVVMAKYRAIDVIRAESTRRRRQQHVASRHEVERGSTERDVADTVVEADDESRRLDAVRAAVVQLPALQRASIELAYFDGHTFREVARITGVPEGTAKSRLLSALHRLHDQLPARPATTSV